MFAARSASCNLHEYVATNSMRRGLLARPRLLSSILPHEFHVVIPPPIGAGAWAKPLAAPTDPRRATPRSPEPANFKNSLRSNALVMARGDASDDRSCGPEHIFPPRVRQRVAALMRGIARYVTMIIGMRDDAGQRFAARNSSLRYIFGKTIPCRLYAVVTVRPCRRNPLYGTIPSSTPRTSS